MRRWVTSRNWQEFTADERCLHHANYAKALAYCSVTSSSYSAKLYFFQGAIDRLACAFRHCNMIESAQTRAHFRASITRQRNWLVSDLNKLKRSKNVAD